MLLTGAQGVLAAARAAGRTHLTELEALELVQALGVRAPDAALVRDAEEARRLDLARFPGERVVVKVVSPSILHKTEVGGVAVVARRPQAVADAVGRMAARLRGADVQGFAVVEFVEHEAAYGGELLLGIRWTEDFGAVVTLGAGGVQAEHLARELKAGRELSLFSPALPLPAGDPLEGSALGPVLTQGHRGRPARLDPAALREVLARCLALAEARFPHDLVELEVNPLVPGARGLVALDALAKLGTGPRPVAPARPLARLGELLAPRTIAVAGVSERMNPGHIILNNVLREGFDPKRVWVVKPKAAAIEGCACVPSIAALPEPVDLLVLAIDAAQVPAALDEVVTARKAQGVIVIPGGLGEREGTEGAVQAVRASLAASRATAWGGPVVNGGNCLGVRSRPGRYDTLFIPEHKIGPADGPESPLAILSQSGAFIVSRANRLAGLNPRYLVSFGNQLDLTVGDYLEHLAGDDRVEVFGCYVEGFQPGDGRRWLEAARRIVEGGRTVILYRAGRTPAGAGAAASHTASIAGDYAVTRELCRRAGVVLADSFADFDDLVGLFTRLRGKAARGLRLGALSNAGFECVAIADSLGALRLAELSAPTRARLDALLKRHRLDGIVSVHNPLDLTPILDDAGYEEAARALLDDPGVDVAAVGCVPMTGALRTLAPGPGHAEDAGAPDAVARRLARALAESPKPAVAVVDGGALYDAMATALEAGGVPVFRSADRALRLLEAWCRSRDR